NMSEPSQEENLVPASFDTLYLAFYTKGPKHTTEDSPELDARHIAHLRYLKSLDATGKKLAGGPVEDLPDHFLRGASLFYNTTLEEVSAFMAGDPQVQAGHFSYKVLTWT